MKEKIKKNKEIALTIALVFGPLLILMGVFLSINMASSKADLAEEVEIEEVEQKIDPFDNVDVSATAAYVKNLNTGEIFYAKNETRILPLASITKIMTVLAAQDILDQDDIIRLDFRSLSEQGEYKLFAGESFTVENLIKLTLVGSVNDTAAALAYRAGDELKKTDSRNIPSEELFVDYMNRLARQIGLENTTFQNETGLDSSEFTAGAKGTAKDITKLMEYVIENHSDLLEITSTKQVTVRSAEGLVHSFENTNQITESLPNLISSKTGFTNIAGGNLTVIIDPGLNTPISITVLSSTKEGRFEDVQELANTVIAHFNNQE